MINEKTIKNYLMRYIRAEEKHERLYQRYEELIETMAALGGRSYGPRVQMSGSASAKFEKLVEQREAVFEKLISAGVEAADIKAELTRQIAEVDDERSQWILREKYINRVSWQDLFEHGEMAERTYYEWHREALGLFGLLWAREIKAWQER